MKSKLKNGKSIKTNLIINNFPGGFPDISITEGRIPIRFEMVSKEGISIGYKIDSFWSLAHDGYKCHEIDPNTKTVEPHLLKNLKDIYKTNSWKPAGIQKGLDKEFFVLVERLDEGGEGVEIIEKYHFVANGEKYDFKKVELEKKEIK